MHSYLIYLRYYGSVWPEDDFSKSKLVASLHIDNKLMCLADLNLDYLSRQIGFYSCLYCSKVNALAVLVLTQFVQQQARYCAV